jgi:hypothetical protein
MIVRPPKCLTCRYDLESSETICPECGTETELIISERAAAAVERLVMAGIWPFIYMLCVDVILALALIASLYVPPSARWGVEIPRDLLSIAVAVSVVAGAMSVAMLLRSRNVFYILGSSTHCGASAFIILILINFKLDSSYGLFLCVVGMYGVFLLSMLLFTVAASRFCLSPSSARGVLLRATAAVAIGCSVLGIGCWYYTLYMVIVVLISCAATLVMLRHASYPWVGFRCAKQLS